MSDAEWLDVKGKFNKLTNKNPRRAVTGDSTGIVIDPDQPSSGMWLVRYPTSNGFSTAVKVRGAYTNAGVLPTAGQKVLIGYDWDGQEYVMSKDFGGTLAAGDDPNSAAYDNSYVSQQTFLTLLPVPTVPDSLIIKLKSWGPVINLVYAEANGLEADFTGNIPASGYQAWVTVVCKSDLTISVYKSTEVSLLGVLDRVTAINENFSAAAADDPLSAPVYSFLLSDDQASVGQADIEAGVDHRQLVNTPTASSGPGSGNVSGAASSTDNAIVRWNGTDGEHIQNSGALLDDNDNLTANEYKLPAAQAVTLASDAFTVTKGYAVITSQSGTTDNLATINGGSGNMLLIIEAATGHTITVKHGTGNIYLSSAADYAISGNKRLQLFFNGTNWSDVAVAGASSDTAVLQEYIWIGCV